MKPDYQFDDPDKTLPVWRVKYQDVILRESRRPFYVLTAYARAKNRAEAIEKVKALFSGKDRFVCSKVK